MSNSYNISVAPEIAALDAVVDAIGLVVTNIHDVDIPAVGAIGTANGVILTDLHDVDLPAVEAIGTANGVILTDLHDVDLPAVITAVGTVKVKGKLIRGTQNNATANYVTAVDVSGQGVLHVLRMIQSAGNTMSLKLTLDDFVYENTSIVGANAAFLHHLRDADGDTDADYMELENYEAAISGSMNLNLDFQEHLKIEHKVDAGNVDTKWLYSRI